MDGETPNEPGVLTEQVAAIECDECGSTIDVSARQPFEDLPCPECGAPQKVPARFGPFLLLDLLGRGGMGGVYLARDESLGRPVAVKVMLQSVGADEALVETFKREARAAAKLNHPHVAQIYSFGQEQGQPYIVMELIKGKSLDTMIEEEEALDQTMVMRVGYEIAEGLRAADEVGLVHGDIKPENILFDDRSRAKLVDFGIATFTGHTDADSIWGTPYYISPEKIRRQAIDARADIYSLGATLYHALAGCPPFEGETPVEVVKARLNRSPTPLREVRSDIDEGVEQIVARMLEVEPGRRYPTYASLLGDLKKVLKDLRQKHSGGVPSKRIRLKRKSEAAAPGATVAAAPPGVKKKPKLVIRMSGTGRGGPLPPQRTSPPVATTPAGPGKTPAVMKGLGIGCLVIVLLAGLSGGGIYFKIHRELKLALRRENYELTQHIESAANSYAGIRELVERINERAGPMVGIASRATNAAAIILGEPPAPSPVDEPAGEDTAEPERPAPTNAVAPALVAGVEPPGPDEGEPVPPQVDLNVVLAEPGDVDGQPEARRKERDILLRVRAVTTAVARANLVLAEAGKRNDQAARAVVSAQAAKPAEELESRHTALKELAERQRKWIMECQSLLRELQTDMRRAMEQRAAERAARESEALAQARRDLLEREREERRAKVEQELEQAAAAADEIKTLLQSNDFGEAAKRLKTQRRTYQTAEGQAAMDLHIDRYTRLEKLKEFLVAQLKKEKMPWGYGFGAAAVDILSADAHSVHVRGGKVPWSAISTAQMVKFLNHFLTGTAAGKPNVKESAEQNVAAATYCFLHGGMDAARMFADQARRLDFRQGETLRRLVPLE